MRALRTHAGEDMGTVGLQGVGCRYCGGMSMEAVGARWAALRAMCIHVAGEWTGGGLIYSQDVINAGAVGIYCPVLLSFTANWVKALFVVVSFGRCASNLRPRRGVSAACWRHPCTRHRWAEVRVGAWMEQMHVATWV